jgi:hypothetical protein
MGQVQRGVVRGSNMESPAGNMKNNGFLPLSGGAGTVHPANHGPGGDHRNGSFPLSAGAAMTKPPDHRFNVGQVGMPDQPFPDQPGKGAVPVNPFLPGGEAARSMPVSDMAPKK